MKNSIKLTLIGLLAFSILACNKEDFQKGRMTVKMTDAPGLYAEVNVEIQEVLIHYADDSSGANNDGWVSLETNSGVYDLLELQNNITAVLADSVELPAGKVNQMRLMLGSDNSVMLIDSTILDLKLSSQQNSGLKFNLNTSIEPNKTVEVLIDFDAEKSLVVQGNGEIKLKPVIQVKSITQL